MPPLIVRYPASLLILKASWRNPEIRLDEKSWREDRLYIILMPEPLWGKEYPAESLCSHSRERSYTVSWFKVAPYERLFLPRAVFPLSANENTLILSLFLACSWYLPTPSSPPIAEPPDALPDVPASSSQYSPWISYPTISLVRYPDESNVKSVLFDGL